MSSSSVALSSLAAARNASTLLEATDGSRVDRGPDDKAPERPVAAPDQQKPVKAALPPTVGQAIDISA